MVDRISERDRLPDEYGDSVFLSNSDNPASQLGSVIFDGSNFVNWSHSVKCALGAKFKLGFIDGRCHADLPRWVRTDYMVRCWISNSMVPSISRSFRYVSSAKELWDELCERYAQSNLPLLYQLRRDLMNLRQGSDSVTDYYGKVKMIWDDIRNLDPIEECQCEARKACSCELGKRLMLSDTKNQIIDFLMGLKDGYEGIRNQILVMDPLPTLNKTFYLVQQIESQKSIHRSSQGISNTTDVSALAAGRQQGRLLKEEYKRMKSNRLCDFCKQKGHLMEACFKLNGFPDWFN